MKNLMPVLFVGHGSPMNALGQNSYAQILGELTKKLPNPKAILMISAHWETVGTKILSLEQPQMIYDFHGFPPELYKINYPAKGNAELANKIEKLLATPSVSLDQSWGLDHGAWAVLLHLFPQADIPVIPMSLNRNLSLKEHYELALKLKTLREEGVLILGSGNVTHNLRQISWEEKAPAFMWAIEFDWAIRDALKDWDIETLTGGKKISPELWRQAHPTLDHYLPLLYVVGAANQGERISFSHEVIQNGSMSMRNVLIGSL